MAVFASGAAFLTISTSASRRQTQEIDNLRAFYVAEAGLAEAFQAVRIGRSGQIGSEETPAIYGDGLLWVTATDIADEQVRLECTALVGTGRSALSYVVEPVPTPLGFFSDEPLVVDSVLMVDGFDSTEGTYDAGTGLGMVKVKKKDPFLHVDGVLDILFYEGVFYHFTEVSKDEYYYDASVDWVELTQEPFHGLDPTSAGFAEYAQLVAENAGDLNEDDFTDDDGADFEDIEYDVVVAYLDLLMGGGPGPARGPSGAPATEEVTTSEGALIGSNGSVVFSAAEDEPIAVFGDVIPGPDATVQGLDGAYVSGNTDPRPAPVELPPVEVPSVGLDGPTRHDDLLPMVIAPGTSGFERIEVAADAELVVRGPATVVLGTLILEPGAALTLDTRDGEVELYVTGGMDLQPGSIVTTTNDLSSELSVQVAPIESLGGEAPVKLEATSQFHGTIYAPQTEVYVGTDFEVYGSVVARKLEIGPGARLHFDNVHSEGSPIPETISWRIIEVPVSVRLARGNPFTVLGVAPGDPAALADAHDLASVALTITYLDLAAIERTYDGTEDGFTWSDVSEVLEIRRDPTRVSEVPLENEEEAAPEEEPLGPARQEVLDAIASRSGSTLRTYLQTMTPLSDREMIEALDADKMISSDTKLVLASNTPLSDAVLLRLITGPESLTSGDMKTLFQSNTPLSADVIAALTGAPSTVLEPADKDAILADQ